MNDFSHISLPNPGVTTGIIPDNIYDVIMNEVNEISNDWNSHQKWNDGLVGNIEKQYEMVKSISVLEPYLNSMCHSYGEYWNYHRKTGNYKLSQMWVNFQKKNEFNPVHHHTDLFSFVCWLKIPYKIQDEFNAFHVKDTNAKAASTFQFIYPNILGQLTLETLYVDSDWEKRIVLFPANLSHCVYPFSTSDEYRISISGNLL